MALDFAGIGSGDFLGSPDNFIPVTGIPLSFSAWFRQDTKPPSIGGTLIAITNPNNSAVITLRSDTSRHLIAGDNNGTTFGQAITGTQYNLGTWNHAGARFVSSTSRAVYLNGIKNNNGTSVSPPATGLSTTMIGARYLAGVVSTPWDGAIANVAVWRTGLLDDDFIALANMAHPYTIHPESLVFYAPLNGDSSPEIDLIFGRTVSISGSVTKTDSKPTSVY